MRLPEETADAAAALTALIVALCRAEPLLEATLEAAPGGVQISWRTHERAFLVSAVDDDNRGVPVAAVAADPAVPATFGLLGLPTPIGAPDEVRH